MLALFYICNDTSLGEWVYLEGNWDSECCWPGRHPAHGSTDQPHNKLAFTTILDSHTFNLPSDLIAQILLSIY